MAELFQSAAWPLWSVISLILMSVIYQKNRLCELGLQLIVQAERMFIGQNAGVWKRRWVVRRLSRQVAPLFCPVFTEAVLEELVRELYERTVYSGKYTQPQKYPMESNCAYRAIRTAETVEN